MGSSLLERTKERVMIILIRVKLTVFWRLIVKLTYLAVIFDIYRFFLTFGCHLWQIIFIFWRINLTYWHFLVFDRSLSILCIIFDTVTLNFYLSKFDTRVPIFALSCHSWQLTVNSVRFFFKFWHFYKISKILTVQMSLFKFL